MISLSSFSVQATEVFKRDILSLCYSPRIVVSPIVKFGNIISYTHQYPSAHRRVYVVRPGLILSFQSKVQRFSSQFSMITFCVDHVVLNSLFQEPVWLNLMILKDEKHNTAVSNFVNTFIGVVRKVERKQNNL